MSSLLRCLLFLMLLSAQGLMRGHAEMINYQGRLSIHGELFDGVGRFRFAVVGEQGRILWSSSELKVQVSKGEYSVRLGDSAQAPSVDGELLRQSVQPPRLRIWFAREGEAWVRVGADVVLDMHLVGTPSPVPTVRGADARASSANAASAPTFVTLHVGGAPSLGSEKTSLVLVEYTDLRSPACVRFQTEVLPRLKVAYIDTGKLRLVTRVLPSSGASPEDALARAAWCAQAQGKFWEMREKLVASGGPWTAETAAKLSQDAALDAARFSACFADAQAGNAVLRHGAEAAKAGITTTPVLVLGQSAAGMVAGVRLTGEPTFEQLAAEIEKNLAPGGTL
jgi:protein-disulfide isomerase